MCGQTQQESPVIVQNCTCYYFTKHIEHVQSKSSIKGEGCDKESWQTFSWLSILGYLVHWSITSLALMQAAVACGSQLTKSQPSLNVYIEGSHTRSSKFWLIYTFHQDIFWLLNNVLCWSSRAIWKNTSIRNSSKLNHQNILSGRSPW